MTTRGTREKHAGVKTIEEHELEGEFKGPTITDTVRKGSRITAKTTPEERNNRYFAHPIFDGVRDEILDTLENEPIRVLLLPRNTWIASDIATMLLRKYPELSKSKNTKYSTKKLDEGTLEDIEDDIIDHIEDLLLHTTEDKIGDYVSFSLLVANFFIENFYRGNSSASIISKGIHQLLQNSTTHIDLSDEELMLEIVGFLKENLEKEFELSSLLEEIIIVYENYGKEGFPWKLSSSNEVSQFYFKRSDYSLILSRGVKELIPCSSNGCGGLESRTYLQEVRSTDEGKVAKRFCTRCGVQRK